MAATLTLRSWRELRHRKTRTFFTVATIAAAVTLLWLFAVPPLIDDAMTERIDRDLLWDLRLSPNGIVLSEADIDHIRDLPNVAGVEARTTVRTEFAAGGRQMQAWLIGVDDFADQEVNAVLLTEGEAPVVGEMVSDPQNARSGRYAGVVGDRASLGGYAVTVSGIGGTLEFSATVDDADPVFYVPLSGLQDALGSDAVTWIDLRVDDPDPAAMAATAEAVRDYLATVDPEVTYWRVLQTRAPGTWPEQESFDNVIRLTFLIAGLGLLSALLMVFTTMNTIVRSQTRETGILKAVGASRRTILRSYLLTAALLGGIGTVLGVGCGVLLSNLLVGYGGRQFSGVEPALGVPPPVLVLSLAVGIGGTMLATLPAVWRATAIPVREALDDHGIASSFGTGRFDAALQRSRFLPRRVRFGLSAAARRKGRSIATALQIGFAVGAFLGLLALGITVMSVAERSFDGEGGDIWVSGVGNMARPLEEIPGVAEVVPVYYAEAGVGTEMYRLQGQTPNAAALHDHLEAGRWFTQEEELTGRAVTVLGPAVATATGAEIGDVLDVETASGRISFEVVGIDTLMVEDGEVLFTPLSVAIEVGGGGGPGNYFVLTTESDAAFIDGVATRVQDVLEARGGGGRLEVRYIEREAELSQNRAIIAILMILGIPVIVIGMIGLVNTMTTNLLERTREIGILRSIGARARHIRGMIRAEALVLGLVGWLIAIPLGYLIGYLLTRLLSSGFGITLGVLYPLWPVVAAFVLTLVMTALVVQLPVRRAVRLQPGDALRYE